MTTFDLNDGVRGLNAHLHGEVTTDLTAVNPAGRHAVAVGATAAHALSIDGNVGYYCGGMNQHANIEVRGNAGPGLAENIMSGRVRVHGDASQYCAATGHGGLVVVDGNASSRCGISMKGVNIVVRGNVGHMSAFMAQKGCLVVCGDAGDALGDSLYEARLYIRGSVASLGADCVPKPMAAEHLDELGALLREAGVTDADPSAFTRYGSARKLYHFDIDNASDY
ncbi:MAG: protein glxC [Pseudomonadota bacterium]